MIIELSIDKELLIWIKFEFWIGCTISSNLSHPTKILTSYQITPKTNLPLSNNNPTSLIRTSHSKFPASEVLLPQDPNQLYKMHFKLTVNIFLLRSSIKSFRAKTQDKNTPSKDSQINLNNRKNWISRA
jgi:hypothetical protein